MSFALNQPHLDHWCREIAIQDEQRCTGQLGAELANQVRRECRFQRCNSGYASSYTSIYTGSASKSSGLVSTAWS